MAFRGVGVARLIYFTILLSHTVLAVAVVPLIAALVVFGFWPMPMLDAVNPTVDSLLQHVGVTDDPPTVPVAEEGAH